MLAGDLFISEYVEGSSNNKAVELYNNSAASIDLTGHSLQRFSNGGTTPAPLDLAGLNIAAGGTIVLANPNADPAILAAADLTSATISHNGDDAYQLVGPSGVLDTFGVVGTDPGSAWTDGAVTTVNSTLRRDASVSMGDVAGFDPISNLSAQWDAFPNNTFDGLGSHSVGGAPDSSFVLINEILFDVPGVDTPAEYVELRGDASSKVANGTYLLDIEGDTSSGFGIGKVSNVFDLSGLNFGSNGYLVLSQTGSGYTIDAASNSLVSGTSDFGGFSFFSSDVAANQIENATNSFLLVESPTAPTTSDDIDINDDGTIDGALAANWTLLDSVGISDGGGSDVVYADVSFTLGGGANSGYVGRIGDSVGSTATDWVAAEVSGSLPSFVLDVGNTIPASLGGSPLDHIGASNAGTTPGGLVVSESGDSTVVAEGGPGDTLEISLASAPTADVKVSLSVTDGESTVSTSPLVFTSVNWNSPQSVNVAAVDDSDVEGGHVSEISITSSSTDMAFNGLTTMVTASVIDNDVDFVINEARISHPTLDNNSNNFIEVFETGGAAGISTDGLTLLVVTSETDAQNVPPNFTAGDLNFAFDLTGGMTDANGFLLLADDGSSAPIDSGDIQADFDFFGSPTTFLLVSGYTGPLGSFLNGVDLDTDETEGGDGVFDSPPWASVLDAVTLADDDGDAMPTKNYAVTDPTITGGSVVTLVGGFSPAAVARIPDGGTFEELVGPGSSFGDDSEDTPGSTNVPVYELTESGGSTGVVEGGPTDTFDFVLTQQPTNDVTVTFTITDGQTTVSDSTLTFTSVNWNSPQTVTVTAVDDANDAEGLHSGIIAVSTTSADSRFDAVFVPEINVTVADNAVTASNLVLNEVRISHDSLDNASNNFVELYDTTGAAGTDATGLTLVVLSGAFNPGQIDFAIPLDGSSTDSNGFLLVHDDGSDAAIAKDPGDLELTNLDFFGSPQTFLLVSGFTGATGVDLDATDDGVLDATPWTAVFDSLALDTVDNNAFTYGFTPSVTSMDDNAAAGARRIEDGSGTPIALEFISDAVDTPGETNVLPAAVRVLDEPILVSEKGLTDQFRIVLDKAPTSNVTVTLDPDAQTALLGQVADASASFVFTPGNWFQPQMVTVAAADDAADEGDHTAPIAVTIATTDADYSALTPADIQVAIFDNDNANHAVVINEVLKDPAPGDEIDPLAGDANGDGVNSATEDEFVEILNTGESGIDISGWTINDAGGERHVFPAGTTLAGGQAIVVFGGGTLGTYGNSLSQVASTGGLQLNNGADTVTLSDGVRTIDTVSWEADNANPNDFDGIDESLARDPDGTGDFFDSTFVTFFLFTYTPGLSNVDGSEFEIGASIVLTETDGSTNVTEGGNTDTVDIVLTGTPTADVTVTLTPADSQIDLGAGVGLPLDLTFTPANAATAQTVTVTANDDAVAEGAHGSLFSVSSSSTDTAFLGLATPDVAVSIADNDALPQTTSLLINELRINSTGGSITDFVELIGDPIAALDGLTLLLVSGEFSPGQIDAAIDLSAGSTDADGFLLVTDDGTSVATDPGDLVLEAFAAFGSPQTVIVVEDFTGAAGDDLDTNDDGTFDTTPWTSILDSVSLVDGDGTVDVNYSSVVVGPDGNFVPAGAARDVDATGTFQILSFFDSDGDTPGATNEAPPTLSIEGTTDGDETGPVSGVLTVSQSKVAATNTVISYSVGGTATSGSDYTPLSGTVTILAGDLSAEIVVPVIDDADLDPLETVEITLTAITSSDPGVRIGSNATASIVIINNDGSSGLMPGDLVVNEIMQNPNAVGDGFGEYFEIWNTTGAAIDIDGFIISDLGSNSHTINNGGPLLVAAGDYFVLGINGDMAANGGVPVDYVYSDFALSNSDDEVLITDDFGLLIDQVNYDGGPNFPDPSGASMELIPGLADPSVANDTGSNWQVGTVTFGSGDLGTPGAVNSTVVTDTTPPTITSVIASGSDWTPLFVDAADGAGVAAGNGLGFELTSGQLIANAGVDTFHFLFSEGVVGFDASAVEILGVNTADYSGSVQSVSYDAPSLTGTVTLSEPIVLDKIRLAVSDSVTDTAANALDGDGDTVAGGILDLRIDIIVGDANGDGLVEFVQDVPLFGASFNRNFGQPTYDIAADWNSDGIVTFDGDVPLFGVNFNRSLPTAEPGASSFGAVPTSEASDSLESDAIDSLMSSLAEADSNELF